MHALDNELCNALLRAANYQGPCEQRNIMAVSVLVNKLFDLKDPSSLKGLAERYLLNESLRTVSATWNCSTEAVRVKLRELEHFISSHTYFIRVGVMPGEHVPDGYLNDLCCAYGLETKPIKCVFNDEYRNASIDVLGLSKSAEHALKRFGIYSLGDLVSLVEGSSN